MEGGFVDDSDWRAMDADSTVVRVDEGSHTDDVPLPSYEVDAEEVLSGEGYEEVEGGAEVDDAVAEAGVDTYADTREKVDSVGEVDTEGYTEFDDTVVEAESDATAIVETENVVENNKAFDDILTEAEVDTSAILDQYESEGVHEEREASSSGYEQEEEAYDLIEEKEAERETEIAPEMPEIPDKLEDFPLPGVIATEVKYFVPEETAAKSMSFVSHAEKSEETRYQSYTPESVDIEVLTDSDLDGIETDVLDTTWLSDSALAMSGADGKVSIWDVKLRRQICSFQPYPVNDPVVYIASLSNAIDEQDWQENKLKLLTVSGESRTLRIWEIKNDAAKLMRSVALPMTGGDVLMTIPLAPRPDIPRKTLSFSTVNEYDDEEQDVPEPEQTETVESRSAAVVNEEPMPVFMNGQGYGEYAAPPEVTMNGEGHEESTAPPSVVPLSQDVDTLKAPEAEEMVSGAGEAIEREAPLAAEAPGAEETGMREPAEESKGEEEDLAEVEGAVAAAAVAGLTTAAVASSLPASQVDDRAVEGVNSEEVPTAATTSVPASSWIQRDDSENDATDLMPKAAAFPDRDDVGNDNAAVPAVADDFSSAMNTFKSMDTGSSEGSTAERKLASGNDSIKRLMGKTQSGAIGSVEEESTAKSAFESFKAHDKEDELARAEYNKMIEERMKLKAAATGAAVGAAAGATTAAVVASGKDDDDEDNTEFIVEEHVVEEEEEVEIDAEDDDHMGTEALEPTVAAVVPTEGIAVAEAGNSGEVEDEIIEEEEVIVETEDDGKVVSRVVQDVYETGAEAVKDAEMETPEYSDEFAPSYGAEEYDDEMELGREEEEVIYDEEEEGSTEIEEIEEYEDEEVIYEPAPTMAVA